MNGRSYNKVGSVIVVFLMVLTALAVLSVFQPAVQAAPTNTQNLSGNGSLTKEIHINIKDLKYVIGPNGNRYLIGKGMRILAIPGKPVVPMKIVKFTLPKNAKDVGVYVKDNSKVSYGKLKISPYPAPVSKSGKVFPAKYSFKYNHNVYGKSKFYPYKEYTYTVSHSKQGTIVNVYLYPVKYNPVTGEVKVTTDLKVNINYEVGAVRVGTAPINAPNIIITSPQLKAAAQRLADFHNSTGITSWVVTTTWIAKNFQPASNPPVNGYGNATTDPYGAIGGYALPIDKSPIIGYNYTLAKKIVAFLQNETLGSTSFVTIFGNARMVPPSYYWLDQMEYILAYFGIPGYSYYDGWIPTDAFYADPIYNSTSFDYEPWFFTGRIPVNPMTANQVVDKIIYYGTHKTGNIENVTLSGGQVFETPYFLGETGVLEPLNAGWLDGTRVTEYFHTLRNFTYNNFVKMMYTSDMIVEITHGSGFSFWHHNDEVSAWDFNMNSSYSNLPIYISGSCLNGAWDEEVYPSTFASGINGGTSIAEKMLYTPDGIIAYFGADREAYGSTYAYFNNGVLVAPNDFGDLITEDGTVAGYYLATHYYGMVTLGMMYTFAQSLYNYWLGPELRMVDPWDTGLNENLWQRSYFEYSLLGDPALKVSGSGAANPAYNQPNVVIPHAVYNYNDVPMIVRGKSVSVNISTDSPKVKVELLYQENDYGMGPYGGQPTYYDFILNMKTLTPVASSGGVNNFTYKFTPNREGTYILSVYGMDGKNTRFYMSCMSPLPPLQIASKKNNKQLSPDKYSTQIGANGPDVQIITLLDYGQIVFGKTTNVTAVLYNAGDTVATNIVVHFYLENYVLVFQQGNLSHPLVWLGNKTVSSLAPGQMTYVTIPWKAVNLIPLGLDPTNSSARWQYLVARADTPGDVNPSNNATWALFHVRLPVDAWAQKVFIEKDPTVGESNNITFEITNIGISETATTNYTVMDMYTIIATGTVTLAPGQTKFITVPWTPQYAGTDAIMVQIETPGDINTANDVSFYYPNGYWSIYTFTVLSYDVAAEFASQNNDNLSVELYNYGPLTSPGTSVDLYEYLGVTPIDVESPHPYPNNYDHTWEITAPNATQIALHFQYLMVEPTYDYVYIYNETGALQIEYTGFYTNMWTPYINGSTVYVELVSDEAVNYTGFYIDMYSTGMSHVSSGTVGAIGSGQYAVGQVPLGDTTAGTHYYKVVINTPGEAATLTTGGANNNIIYPVVNIQDTIAPQIKSFSLANAVTNDRTPTLKFAWYDEIYSGFSQVIVKIDGITIPAQVTANGNEGSVVADVPFLLADGTHTVDLLLVDNGGNSVQKSWTFEVDTTPPSLEINTPLNMPLTYDSVFWINGTTTPGATVTINGENVAVDASGSFSYKATLTDGENLFKVVATDEVGNSAQQVVAVLYLPQLPQLWNAINDLSAQIGNLKSEVSNIENELSSLKTTVSSLQDQLNTLKYKLNNLENALQENVSALNKAIEDMNTTLINKINSDIQNLQTQINSLKKNADDMQSTINNIQTKNKEQGTAINTASYIGYAGIIIAIIALIIALVAVTKKPKQSTPKKEPEVSEEVPLEEESEEKEE